MSLKQFFRRIKAGADINAGAQIEIPDFKTTVSEPDTAGYGSFSEIVESPDGTLFKVDSRNASEILRYESVSTEDATAYVKELFKPDTYVVLENMYPTLFDVKYVKSREIVHTVHRVFKTRNGRYFVQILRKGANPAYVIAAENGKNAQDLFDRTFNRSVSSYGHRRVVKPGLYKMYDLTAEAAADVPTNVVVREKAEVVDQALCDEIIEDL